MKLLNELFFWFFGVATCSYYTAITLNGCSQAPYLLALFFPLVLIPFANAVLLWITDRPSDLSETTIYWLGTLNSLSIVVAGLLTTVLSPLCLCAALMGIIMIIFPPACCICIYYLSIALGPIITALAMRKRLKSLPTATAGNWLPLSSCFAAVICIVLMSVFPVLLTRECEESVTSKQMVPQSLLLLRALGNDNTLLQACYGEMAHVPWFFGLVGAFLDHGYPDVVHEQEAREIYYRVKGKPFNTVPRSQRFFQKSYDELLALDEFLVPFVEREDAREDDYPYCLDFSDHDFAGETVGGVVRGLSMTNSEMNAWFNADEAVSHLKWTMNFAVEDGRNKEIRAQLLLPPHAVVTGCTLWLKGVRHDCVIATRNSTRKAYVSSASVGEKPFLVSTAGAGRVLIQSPTGSWGKDARMVVEITSPLVITKPDQAALLLPTFTERNFSVNTQHVVTISDLEKITLIPTCKFSDADLNQGKGVFLVKRDASIQDLVTPTSPSLPVKVREHLTAKTYPASYPTVFVLDGSQPMQGSIGTICDSLQKLSLSNASIIWASDKPLKVVSEVSTDSQAWKNALNRVRDSSCLGGQNNAEALSLALEKLCSCKKEKNELHIVWLHAGQPSKFSGDDLLNQINSARHEITLYEYQVVPGPNETIKLLDQTARLVQVPCMGTLANDLNDLCDKLSGRKPVYQFVRDVATGEQNAQTAKCSLELEQIFVANMIRLEAGKPDAWLYGKMAEQLSLVTPLTNALVLEHQSDYAKYGVQKHSDKGYTPAGDSKPVEEMLGGIPIKPEPPLWLTLCCALFAGALGLYTTRKMRRSA